MSGRSRAGATRFALASGSGGDRLAGAGPVEGQLAVGGVDADHVALGELALEQLQRQAVDELLWITRFSGRAP